MQSPIEQKIKENLDTSLKTLDPKTLEKLNAARKKALYQPNKKAEHLSWLHFLYTPTLASLVCCALLTITLLPFINRPDPGTSTPINAVDQTAMIELIDEPEDLDALSDPGFYLWLDEYTEQSKETHEA